MPKCPTCDSPDPKKHPAMQYEGEVQICKDPFHTPSDVDALRAIPDERFLEETDKAITKVEPVFSWSANDFVPQKG